MSNHHYSRRKFLAASAAGLASAASGFAPIVLAQDNIRTARVVVGFPAGGGTDVLARLIAERLRGRYADAVIVENRAGAGARIGIDYVNKADADGSVMLFTPDFPMTVYPHSFKNLRYNPLRDFTPVARCAKSMLVMSGGPMLPDSVRTVADFVRWAKANPKQSLAGDTGAGGTPHFVGVMVSRAAGFELTPVHYKGGAPALQALMGGQIPVSVNPIGEILPHAKSGKIRVLATTSAQRTRFLPDTPTMAESGYKDIVIEGWLGFFVSSKTPKATVAKLSNAVREALESEEINARFKKFGNVAAYLNPADTLALLKADIERWGPIVKASGFSAEDS